MQNAEHLTICALKPYVKNLGFGKTQWDKNTVGKLLACSVT